MVKCLLVDDLEENLVALSALLSADDVELLEARSGAEALELLLRARRRAGLPRRADAGHGRLRARRADARQRAHAPRADHLRHRRRARSAPAVQGLRDGAVDFLYKPIEPHILKNKADVFFQLYRQKQQLAQRAAASAPRRCA